MWGVTYQGWFDPSPKQTEEEIQKALKVLGL